MKVQLGLQKKEKNLSELLKNDLLIKVSYSSINFKDALSASGNKGVTRKFPHIPGIDAVGTVAESNSKKFPIGSKVLVTGFDLEMNTWGGFGEYISIPEKWAVHLPAGNRERGNELWNSRCDCRIIRLSNIAVEHC